MTASSQRPASPSHNTVDGHAFLSLRALAKRDGRTSAEYLRLYAFMRLKASWPDWLPLTTPLTSSTSGAHLNKAALTRHGSNGGFQLKKLRLPSVSAGRAPMRPFGEARSRRSG